MSKRNYILRSLTKATHKREESYVINRLYALLNNDELEFVTQQLVITKNEEGKIENRLIDMYFPQINIAIEIDENYHNSDWQSKLDANREMNIKNSLENSLVAKDIEIKFIRIEMKDLNDITSLNKRIEEVSHEINLLINKMTSPLKWIFDEEEKINLMKKRGTIERGDSFSTIVSIVNTCANKNYIGFQRSTYKLHDGQIWSPTLSFAGESRAGWINEVTPDLTEIHEIVREDRLSWFENQTLEGTGFKRFVFAKYKDSLGNKKRRFLGVYKDSGYNKDTRIKLWKLVSTSMDI